MITELTDEWIAENKPCKEALDWWDGETRHPIMLIRLMVAADKLEWANWLIARVMNRPQRLRYAVYAAEKVLHIYEGKYPADKRPRKAIEAAKACIECDSEGNRELARTAAAAAYAAAYVAAGYAAAFNDVNAALAAYAAAYVAAGYAGYAGYAAYAAADDGRETMVNILDYGTTMLEAERYTT